jgi:predicted O-methyltransferase YrrM
MAASAAEVRPPESRPGPTRRGRPPVLLSLAARKAIRQRMLMLRQASLDRLTDLAGVSRAELKNYRHELTESQLPDELLQRGAGLPFTQELPQGALLYLLARALRPTRVIETGIRPGYSTAWLLAALEANRLGSLVSLGPGTTAGRAQAVHNVTVGQFVPPRLRARWTLVLGNTEEHLQRVLDDGEQVDLFFYDNGPDAARARFELRSAWTVLSPSGVLLAHHIDANPVWSEFCRGQGLTPQLLDWGPPPMGALGMRTPGRHR